MSKSTKRDETGERALQRASQRRIRDEEQRRLYEAEMRGELPLLSAAAYSREGVSSPPALQLVREA